MTSYFVRLGSFSRDVRLFFITACAVGFAFDGGIYSVIFNLYLLRLEYGPAFIGQVNSAGLLAFSVCSLPAGALGARFGSRRVMVAGLALMLVGCTALPLAEFSPPGWQASWLLVTYILVLVGVSLYFVNAAPFLMRAADPTRRNQAVSVQTALLALAAFVGSLVGGFLPGMTAALLGINLDQAAAYRYPLLTAALLLLPAVFVMRATSPANDAPADDDEDPLSSDANTGKVLRAVAFPLVVVSVLVGVRLFQVAGIAATFTFFNVYLDDGLGAPTAQIGVLTGLGRLLAVPAALLTPVLAARFGNSRVVVWASFLGAVVLLPLALIPTLGAAGFGYVGIVALSSIRYPAFLVYSMELVPGRFRGPVAGAGEMAAGMSFSVMALLGGYLIATSGYQSLFLLSAGLTVVGALLFWFYFRVPRGELAKPIVVEGQ